jgi:solute carrier family 6 amino acid transporter-like protein 5/7/9/14
VWRYPYLAYRNGGGAFLIPYFLAALFIGLPIFFVELLIGQYSGLGPIKAFSFLAPIFRGNFDMWEVNEIIDFHNLL